MEYVRELYASLYLQSIMLFHRLNDFHIFRILKLVLIGYL
jgi:hypothetical protein